MQPFPPPSPSPSPSPSLHHVLPLRQARAQKKSTSQVSLHLERMSPASCMQRTNLSVRILGITTQSVLLPPNVVPSSSSRLCFAHLLALAFCPPIYLSLPLPPSTSNLTLTPSDPIYPSPSTHPSICHLPVGAATKDISPRPLHDCPDPHGKPHI